MCFLPSSMSSSVLLCPSAIATFPLMTGFWGILGGSSGSPAEEKKNESKLEIPLSTGFHPTRFIAISLLLWCYRSTVQQVNKCIKEHLSAKKLSIIIQNLACETLHIAITSCTLISIWFTKICAHCRWQRYNATVLGRIKIRAEHTSKNC